MTPWRHPARGVIDFTGAALSVAALAVLLVRASTQGTARHIVSFAVYGASLTAMWTVSGLYHCLPVSERAAAALRRADHAMIYFLIAGTYTPICLVVLRGGWGWTLFGVIWALAAAGISSKLLIRAPSRKTIVLLFTVFIIMGWLVVIAWEPLVRVLPPMGVFWLVLGGVLYTGGAVVLNIKRFNILPGFGAHELWHLFVLAGSFSHFWMMFRYVAHIRPH